MPSGLTPLVVVTGPGGVRAPQALTKLQEFAARPPHNMTIAIRELDDQLVPEYQRQYPDDGPQARRMERFGLPELLLRPKEIILELWRRVAETAIRECAFERDHGVDMAILSFHAIFYNNRSREFFSPVDVAFLRERLLAYDFELKRIVTLIDDIYDVFRHLASPPHVFQLSVRSDPIKKTTQAILNLQLALDWRSFELLQAGQLCRSAGLPRSAHVELSVKHSLNVGYRVIIEGSPTLYISHPITILRHDLDFQRDVQSLGAELLRAELPAPITPTSIDELRLAATGSGSERRYHPRLTQRWLPEDAYLETHAGDLLFEPPRNLGLNPLDPDQALGADADEFLSGLLLNLVDSLNAHIASRDRTLVEQASLLIVWRPLLKGILSQGVKAEIEHRNSLRQHRLLPADGTPCFVYSPDADLADFRLNALLEALRQRARHRSGAVLSDEHIAQLRSSLRIQSGITRNLTRGAADPDEIFAACQGVIADLVVVGDRDESALGGTPEVEEQAAADDAWVEEVRRVNGLDPLAVFLSDGDFVERKTRSIHEFVELVIERWSAK